MFDVDIVKVEEKDGKLYLYDGIQTSEGIPEEIVPWEEVAWLKPFPPNLSKENKWAVLAYRASTDSIVWLQEVVQHFLKGLSQTC